MKKFLKTMTNDVLNEKINAVDCVVYGFVLVVTYAAVLLLSGVVERLTQ